MGFTDKNTIDVSREHVELSGTTFVGEVDTDIDRLVRHLDSLGFKFEYDECVTFVSSVVDGVVYRNPNSSPSAKFGDTRELTFQICDDSLLIKSETVHLISELNEGMHIISEDLPITIKKGVSGYTFQFKNNDFQELRMATTHSEYLEEREDCVVYDDGEFNVKILPDLTAYPMEEYEDEEELVISLLNELNSCFEV